MIWVQASLRFHQNLTCRKGGSARGARVYKGSSYLTSRGCTYLRYLFISWGGAGTAIPSSLLMLGKMDRRQRCSCGMYLSPGLFSLTILLQLLPGLPHEQCLNRPSYIHVKHTRRFPSIILSYKSLCRFTPPLTRRHSRLKVWLFGLTPLR